MLPLPVCLCKGEGGAFGADVACHSTVLDDSSFWHPGMGVLFSILKTRKYVPSTFKTMQSYLLFSSLGYLPHATVGLLTKNETFPNLERGRCGLGLQPPVLPLLTSRERGRTFSLRMLTQPLAARLPYGLQLFPFMPWVLSMGFLFCFIPLNHGSGLLFCRDHKECSRWRLRS